MMKKRNSILIMLFVAVLTSISISSCKDVIAKNISGSIPTLILPVSLDSVAENPVHFKWEEMEGASKYHLQIATPSFSNISKYVLDTIISSTDFYYSLDSAQYEMKLTASNGAYNSKTLGPIMFFVAAKSNGNSNGNTSINLTSPVDSAFVNPSFNTNNSFTWSQVTGATSYEFQLRKGDSYNNSVILYTETHSSNSTEQTLPQTATFMPLTQAKYYWRVQALNASENQIAQKHFSFTMDTLKPGQATITAPTSQTIVNKTDSTTFTWTIPTQTLDYQSQNKSILEISTSSNLLSPIVYIELTGTTINLLLSNLTVGTTYYCRVRTKDTAGNNGIPSEIITFTLQ